MKAILGFCIGMVIAYFLLLTDIIILGIVGMFVPFVLMLWMGGYNSNGDNSWLDNDGDW